MGHAPGPAEPRCVRTVKLPVAFFDLDLLTLLGGISAGAASLYQAKQEFCLRGTGLSSHCVDRKVFDLDPVRCLLSGTKKASRQVKGGEKK